jgi:hypothetical protein
VFVGRMGFSQTIQPQSMLSNNNMLTVGGGHRPRARGTVRVSEPAYGFFIAGSSIDQMNGVYVRRNPPRTKRDPNDPPIALYYEHEEGLWHMALNELINTDDVEEEEDESYYYHSWKPKKKRNTHEWIFMDEFFVPRFSHEGDTIIPGAGVRWSHIKKKAPTASVPKPDDTLQVEEKESWFSPYSFQEPEPVSSAITEIKEDNKDELPWQVIAILDVEMVQQLLWSSQHRKQKVKDAQAGKNAKAPSRTSLEASFAPGRWLFRVAAPQGVVLRVSMDEGAPEAGTREKGEYLRAVRIDAGEWIKLDPCEDFVMDQPKRGGRQFDRFYNAEYGRRSLYVRMYSPHGSDDTPLVEEVSAQDTAVMDLKTIGESDNNNNSAEGELKSGEEGKGGAMGTDEVLTGDLFDRPFVPRMEDSSATSQDDRDEKNEGMESIQEVLAAATSASTMTRSVVPVPVGVAVEIQGLPGRDGAMYTGAKGVVVSGMESGRQAVRLEAPYR